MLSRREREELWAELRAMPEFLAEKLGSLPAEVARRAEPEGVFSPVEHCWHLADLELEGYGARIERLLREIEPALLDFDGARIAEERQYRTKSLPEAIEAFREARNRNLAAFAALSEEDWLRSGRQEGVGPVALSDLPSMMAEHDRAHRVEIEAWRRARL
jgi:uncharacterized damage-inducible protein DinB